MYGVSIIERAFQLAGECESVAEVRRRLINEGYVAVGAHLSGRQIQRDISSRLNPELRAALKSRRLNDASKETQLTLDGVAENFRASAR